MNVEFSLVKPESGMLFLVLLIHINTHNRMEINL